MSKVTSTPRHDGQRQAWATIRNRLSAGLREPIDLDATTGLLPRSGDVIATDR
jgi:hypothetical protein